MTIKLAIAGSSGRMGRMLIETIASAEGCQLHAALDRQDSPTLGQDATAFLGRECGVKITADLNVLKGADILIDFTRPEGTLAHMEKCREFGVNMIIGTTGIEAEGEATIAAASNDIAIVYARNMSVGMNVVYKLLEIAAKALATGYDIEILEMHHRMKVDAPSGTAISMGEIIAESLGRDLKECAIYGREGVTGERDPSTIGFATLRGGDIVGDHTAIFAGMGERVEITHKASNRTIYAQGCIRAARFLSAKKAGLYNMQDVLGLR
ncbi:MAG: 4-hydroxy-tetrahydrodipicolinate reductase [Formivibrio sp.]|nr:4-hydroxy-tetrahydrodipicolinate reductase [Formivibrio sp.]